MTRYARAATFVIALIFVVMLTALPHNRVHAQTPAPSTIRVDAAHEGWVDTGIDLHDGDTVTLAASGTAGWGKDMRSGPEGVPGGACRLIAPDAPIGALVARVGAGAPVVAGASATLAGPGRLWLLYNDCPGQYFDNSGAFDVAITVTPAPSATAAPAPVATAETHAVTPAPVPAHKSGGLPVLPILLGVLALGAVGAGAFYGRRWLARGPTPRFSPAARLESSAWLAPVRLRLLQGERRPRRWLTIGGPDADVDFGLPGVWARLLPMDDGGARLEVRPNSGRILVDGVAVVIGQRLKNGSRVFMGTREFVFRTDAEDKSSGAADRYRHRDNILSKPDPRVA